jgi:hypothetical protein
MEAQQTCHTSTTIAMCLWRADATGFPSLFSAHWAQFGQIDETEENDRERPTFQDEGQRRGCSVAFWERP